LPVLFSLPASSNAHAAKVAGRRAISSKHASNWPPASQKRPPRPSRNSLTGPRCPAPSPAWNRATPAAEPSCSPAPGDGRVLESAWPAAVSAPQWRRGLGRRALLTGFGLLAAARTARGRSRALLRRASAMASAAALVSALQPHRVTVRKRRRRRLRCPFPWFFCWFLFSLRVPARLSSLDGPAKERAAACYATACPASGRTAACTWSWSMLFGLCMSDGPAAEPCCRRVRTFMWAVRDAAFVLVLSGTSDDRSPSGGTSMS
jgi:hypothetical protein